MNNSSTGTLRSGKMIASTSSDLQTESPKTQNSNIGSNNNSSNEQSQSGRNSPTNESDLQQVNEERFNHLQGEMATLKTMMEKLNTQNEERNRKLDASTATSSFAVRSFNRQLLFPSVVEERPGLLILVEQSSFGAFHYDLPEEGDAKRKEVVTDVQPVKCRARAGSSGKGS